MPRTRRWNEVVHSLRAGVLSPAAQDQVDAEAWLAGAARLENFTVLRDGGVRGRPAFIRGEITAQDRVGPVIPQPTQGLLAGAEWRSDFASGRVRTFEGGVAPTSGTFPPNLYTAGFAGGIAPLGRVFNVAPADTIDVTDDVLEIDLASATPRALVLHGVYLVEGSWQSPDAANDGTPANAGMEMTFAAYVVRHGETAQRPVIATPSPNPFLRGQVAPGILPRDLVIPLVPPRAGTVRPDPVDVAQVRLRIASPRAAKPLSLAIGGVSCFAGAPPAGFTPDTARPAVALPPGFFNAPFRVVPWHVSGVVYVLVLGMEWLAYYRRDEGRTPFFQQGGPDLWSFTERQIRELTWTPFGTSILLFHHDFPHPLEVVFPTQTSPLLVRYLDLTNVQEAPADAQAQALRRSAVAQVLLESRAPESLRALARGTSLTIGWVATGVPRYRVRWAQGNMPPSTWPNDLFVEGNTHILEGLTFGNEYIVQVSGLPSPTVPADPADAVDQDATGESDPVQQVFTMPWPRPAAVTNLRAAVNPAADGGISVSWSAVADATEYQMAYRLADDTSWTIRDPVSGTSDSVDLAAGQRYFFSARANRGTGTGKGLGPWTRTPSALTARNRAPAAPSSISVTDGSAAAAGRLNVTWPVGARADRYELQVQASGGAWLPLYTGTSRSRSYNGTPGISYRFRVKSTRAHATDSAWRTSALTQARNAKPGRVGQPSAARVGGSIGGIGFMRIRWPAVSGVSAYDLDYRRVIGGQPSGGWLAAPIGTLGTQRVLRLIVGSQWDFRIRATRPFAPVGDWSPTVRGFVSPFIAQAEPPPPAPGVPSLSASVHATEYGRIDLSWGATTNATAYELQYKLTSQGAGSFQRLALRTAQDTLAYTFRGATGTSYDFRLQAYNGVTPSGYGSTVTRVTTAPPPPPPPPVVMAALPPGEVPNLEARQRFGGRNQEFQGHDVTWGAAPRAETYEYQVTGGRSGTQAGRSLSTGTGATAVRVRGLRAGTDPGPWARIPLQEGGGGGGGGTDCGASCTGTCGGDACLGGACNCGCGGPSCAGDCECADCGF